jgi:hypothetical protein
MRNNNNIPEYQREEGIETYQPLDISSAVQNQMSVIQNFMGATTEVANQELRHQAEQNKYNLQAELSRNVNDIYNQTIKANPNPIDAQASFEKQIQDYNIKQLSNINPLNHTFAKNVLQYYGNHYSSLLQTQAARQALRQRQIDFNNNDDTYKQDVSNSIEHVNPALGDKKWLPTMSLYAAHQKLNDQAFLEGIISPETYKRNKENNKLDTATQMTIKEAKMSFDQNKIEGLIKFKNSIPQDVMNSLNLNTMQRMKVETEVQKYVSQEMMGHELSKSQLNQQIKDDIANTKLNGGAINNKLAAAQMFYTGSDTAYVNEHNFANKIYMGRQIQQNVDPELAIPQLQQIRNTIDPMNQKEFDSAMDAARDDLLKDPAKYAMQQDIIKNMAIAQNNENLANPKQVPSTGGNSVPTPNVYSASIAWQEKMGLQSLDATKKNYVQILPNDEMNNLIRKINLAAENKNVDDLGALFSSARKEMGSAKNFQVLLNNLHSNGMPLYYYFIANVDPSNPQFRNMTTALLLNDKDAKTLGIDNDQTKKSVSSLVNAQLSNSNSTLSKYVASVNASYGTYAKPFRDAVINSVNKFANYTGGDANAAVNNSISTLLSNFNFTTANAVPLAIPKQYDAKNVDAYIVAKAPDDIMKFPFNYESYAKTPNLSERANKQNFINDIATGHFILSSDSQNLIWVTNQGRKLLGKYPGETQLHPFTIPLNNLNAHIPLSSLLSMPLSRIL